MRHTHTTRFEDLRQPAWTQWIADVLGLTDYSDQLPRTALAQCLLLAAALGRAVSAVARRASGCGRETVRTAIRAALPADPRDLERRLAAGLRHHLPRPLRRRPIPIAIDVHRRPYYGDRDRTPGVTGGKAERGTHWFWSYATAVSLAPGHRHTLALTTAGPRDTPEVLVDRLLAQVGWSGVRVRYVLLDRAFYAVGVIRALQRRGLRFIIPVLRRGVAAKTFFRRTARGWFEHTLCSHRTKQRVSVRVAVVSGPDGRRPLVYGCSGGFHALPKVVLRYRRRFGIETSYRQLGECLAYSSSRDGVYRLLLVGVSLLIRSVWVGLAGVTLGAVRWWLVVTLTPPGPERHPAQTVPPHTDPAT
jgi:putative transposase